MPMHVLTHVSVAAILAASLALCRPACAQTPSALVSVAGQIVRPGQKLIVTVEGVHSLSRVYRVNPAGAIHMELTDDTGSRKVSWDVTVAGKPVTSAAAAIANSLKAYLKAPVVTVSSDKSQPLQVTISGPVARPGMLTLPAGADLSAALAAAGALPAADRSRVLLLRPDGPGGAIHTTCCSIAGAGAAGPALQDGDRIIVLPTTTAPVAASGPVTTARVVGMVGHEGDVPVAAGTRILDVIQQVGGLAPGADARHIRLHRASGDKDYVVDLEGAEKGDAADNIAVRPGDYIVVDRGAPPARFAVAGEVAAPNLFDERPGASTTILTAIEEAGGATKRADVHHGVLRQHFLIDPTHPRDIPFDYAKIKQGQAPDYAVSPGDMVVLLPRHPRPTFWQSILPFVLRFLPL